MGGRARALLEALPLTVAALGALGWMALSGDRPPHAARIEMAAVEVDSAAALETLFSDQRYAWPPAGPVPAIALERLPGDLAARTPEERKNLFLRTLLPLLLAENSQILKQREYLLAVFAEGPLAADDSRREPILRLAQYYRVGGEPNQARFRHDLVARVDTVPAALALAQAASESGWGTSRLALEANNLFGQYTPRPPGSDGPAQLPARFPDLRSGVRSYLRNLNSSQAYAGLRRIRARERARDQAPDPARLAEGLHRYSSRGRAYIEEVQHLIRSNGLDALTPLPLAAE